MQFADIFSSPVIEELRCEYIVTCRSSCQSVAFVAYMRAPFVACIRSFVVDIEVSYIYRYFYMSVPYVADIEDLTRVSLLLQIKII